jgi:hypothetical protein
MIVIIIIIIIFIMLDYLPAYICNVDDAHTSPVEDELVWILYPRRTGISVLSMVDDCL